MLLVSVVDCVYWILGMGAHPSTRSSRASNFSELKTFVDISPQLGRAELDLKDGG